MDTTQELHALRRELIDLLDVNLNKKSRFYKQDYEAMRDGVNRKSRAELTESLDRQRAIAGVTRREIAFHCQLGGLPTPARSTSASRGLPS
ncbi:hypothetical protein [Paraburkholderia youngii]|uniref:hypothetical protein n=1 Tax=Paraburkholderia youngii TaxID=2782701 RepID=UPI003D1924EF